MKTQQLYFRYLSNMDLFIKISFSSDNCTLHILSKDHSLYWLIVNMHCLKVLVQKQVIWLPVMFRMSDLYFCIVQTSLTEWITFSQHHNVDMCSTYQSIRILNLKKLWKLLELVAAVSWKVVIYPVYEPLLHFVCTWHWYKNYLQKNAYNRNTKLATVSMTSWVMK